MSKKRVQWFARGGGLLRCGPFSSQVEAVKEMRLVGNPGDNVPRYPDDIFVWPEETE